MSITPQKIAAAAAIAEARAEQRAAATIKANEGEAIQPSQVIPDHVDFTLVPGAPVPLHVQNAMAIRSREMNNAHVQEVAAAASKAVVGTMNTSTAETKMAARFAKVNPRIGKIVR